MALHWKYVGNQAALAGTAEGALNALYTLGTKATYADGSARTPGTGSAGTWDRYQNGGQTEACWCDPATNPLSAMYLFAGDDAAHAPTMCGTDTWNTNTIMHGVTKNAGAYNAWDNAAPFTTGQFTGFCRGAAVGTITSVSLWESEEGYVIELHPGAGAPWLMIGGELIDAGVTSVTSPFSAETTGHLIYFYTSTSVLASDSNVWNSKTAYGFFTSDTGANSQHGYVLTPGASAAVTNVTRAINTDGPGDGDWSKNPNGDMFVDPIGPIIVTATYVRRGVLREMGFCPVGDSAQAIREGATVKAYIVSNMSGEGMGLVA